MSVETWRKLADSYKTDSSDRGMLAAELFNACKEIDSLSNELERRRNWRQLVEALDWWWGATDGADPAWTHPRWSQLPNLYRVFEWLRAALQEWK